MGAPAGSFDLAALARSRGFDDLATAFEDDKLQDLYYPLEAVPDPALPEEPAALLTLLARYGMRPRLVEALLDRWRDRPLDCALVAWDALNQTALGNSDDDQAFFRRCAALLAPARAILPQPGELCVDLSQHQAAAVLDAHAGPAATLSDEELERAAGGYSLVALRELGKRPFGVQLFGRPGAREALRDYGFLLNNARLPTLASLILDFAFRGLGDPAAVVPLTEVMLDANADRRAPQSGFPSEQVAPPFPGYTEYVMLRKLLVAKDFFNAKAMADKLRGRWFRKPGIGVEVAYPEASGWIYHREPFKRVEVAALVASRPLWRYLAAAKLFAKVGSVEDPESQDPVKFLDEYLNAFGHRFLVHQVYFRLLPKGAKKNPSVRRLINEVAISPWSLEAWESMGSLTTMKDPEANRQRAIALAKQQAARAFSAG